MQAAVQMRIMGPLVMQAPKPTGPPRFAIEATTERINGRFGASRWPRLCFPLLPPPEEEVVSNPTTKQCQGWGRTTAGTEGPREQGTVGESAGPRGPRGALHAPPALAVGTADRTARDGWTDRREWASKWEAGTWSTSRTGRGLRFTWRSEDLAGQRSWHRHGHGQGGSDGAECRARRTRWYGGRRRRESCSDTWDWLDGSVKGLNEKAK